MFIKHGKGSIKLILKFIDSFIHSFIEMNVFIYFADAIVFLPKKIIPREKRHSRVPGGAWRAILLPAAPPTLVPSTRPRQSFQSTLPIL